MERLELHNLLSSYFDLINSTTPQSTVATKSEFADLESSKNEPPPKVNGDLFKHQEFVVRWLSIFDRLFLMHDTGTGKSGSMFGVAEYFSNNKSNIKHVYFITSGQNQVDDLIRQLLCVFANDKYETSKVRNARTTKGQTREINSNIEKWYTITTYQTFMNRVIEKFPDPSTNDKLQEMFSDCIFFMDEIQYLRLDPNESDKDRQRGTMYTTFWRIFHLMLRSKLIITSATPMVNTASEMGPHLNLILPLNMQIYDDIMPRVIRTSGIPLNINAMAKIDWSKVTIQELEPYIRTCVSYIRSPVIGVVPDYKGIHIGSYSHTVNPGFFDSSTDDPSLVNQTVLQSKLILDLCLMKEHQANGYIKSYKGNVMEEEDGDPVGLTRTKNAWFHGPRQAANFVYPDGSCGNEGFDKYVNGTATDKKYFIDCLGNSNLLEQMSSKFYKIVANTCTMAYKRYVYTRYVNGSGGITLGLALEQYSPTYNTKWKDLKYTRFRENTSVFVSASGGISSYCFNKSTRNVYHEDATEEYISRLGRKEKNIQKSITFVRIDKAPRYAIVTRDTPQSEKDTIFELYNSPENALGEYIQVLIISPFGQFGINLRDVMHVDIVSAEWTPSSTYQSRDRAFRITSHSVILEYFRRKYNDPHYTIKVNVHYYASVLDSKGDKKTIEIRAYLKSEYKDLYIRRILRFFKILAVDYFMNRQVNMREDDIEFTQDTDYRMSYYPPYNQPLDIPVSNSTYKAYFYNDIIKKFSRVIVEYWKQNTYGSIQDLVNFYRSLQDPNAKPLYSEIRNTDIYDYFIYALDYNITNKTSYIDELGISCKIVHKNGIYSINRDNNHGYTSNYIKSLTLRKHCPLKIILEDYELESTNKIRNEIMVSNYVDDQIKKLCNNLPINAKSLIIEECVMRLVNPQLNINPSSQLHVIKKSRLDLIYDIFKSNVMYTIYPRTLLTQVSNILSRAIETNKVHDINDSDILNINMNNIDFNFEEKGTPEDGCYIHNIYVTEQDVSHSYLIRKIFKTSGRIRMYYVKEKIWRDPNMYEYIVLSRLFTKYNASISSMFINEYGATARIMDSDFCIYLGASNIKPLKLKSLGVVSCLHILYSIRYKWNTVMEEMYGKEFNSEEAIKTLKTQSVVVPSDTPLEEIKYYVYMVYVEKMVILYKLKAIIVLEMYYGTTPHGRRIHDVKYSTKRELIFNIISDLQQNELIYEYDPEYEIYLKDKEIRLKELKAKLMPDDTPSPLSVTPPTILWVIQDNVEQAKPQPGVIPNIFKK